MQLICLLISQSIKIEKYCTMKLMIVPTRPTDCFQFLFLTNLQEIIYYYQKLNGCNAFYAIFKKYNCQCYLSIGTIFYKFLHLVRHQDQQLFMQYILRCYEYKFQTLKINQRQNKGNHAKN
eukprot:EC096401.1.p1 GENE.EC096401.1~~EC096401.1.p1  ORF type:complete len:121 (-),score=3.14 EC096401.1:145-507(-)